MKKHLFTTTLCSAVILAAGVGCAPSDNNGNAAMDKAMQRVVASIRPTSFPDFTIDVNAPDEADALLIVQEAVDSCSRRGGGTVALHAGCYAMNGTLWLKSNVRLHLMADATLLFSGLGNDFLPPVPTRWEGTELLGRSAMVAAIDAENIAITGQGTIDAQGGIEMASWGMVPGEINFEENVHGTHGETIEMDDVHRLRTWGDHTDPSADTLLTFGVGTFLRPCCIEFNSCQRVLIEGVTVRNSPFWCLHPLYCTDVTVRGVTIDSHFPNNDGCDPESSERVLIEDCLFRTGDDAVAIKSGRDADGRRVGRPSRQIVIRRCQFQSECNGLCIGSEMSGGVEEVFMDSVAIGHVKNALLFKSNKDRGGYIRNVWVRNITVDETAGAVLRFENNYFGYRGGNFPSHYADFQIYNVHANRCGSFAIYCDGLPEMPMERIAVDSLVVDSAALPHYLYNTRECTFRRTWVNGEKLAETLPESETRQSCDVW